MVSFLQTAEAVCNLEPSNRWIHEVVLAKRLGITVDVLEGWMKCVRNGGSGAVSQNNFIPNPAPYNAKIDLTDLSKDNTFNLHYILNRCNSSTPKKLFRDAKYYFIGSAESCRLASLGTEIDIARYVVGEHKDLRMFADIGERRRRLWRSWICGDKEGDEYNEEDLPIIAYFFADYFGVQEQYGKQLQLISPLTSSDLSSVKSQIYDILVALGVLSTMENRPPLVRRSLRLRGDSQDTEIDGITSQRNQQQQQHDEDTRRSNLPQDVDKGNDDRLDEVLGNNDDANEDDPVKKVSFTLLKALVLEGEDRTAGLRRAGVLEAAFKCAHGDGTIAELNMTLFALNCSGADLMSSDEFDRIAALDKSRLVRLLLNFKKLKDEMNKTMIFQISYDKLLLEYLQDGDRYSNGESLTRKIRDDQGHLKPEIAAIFRHILFTNPRLGFKCLNDLFVSFFVVLTGRPPSEDEFSSISTLRLHIARLNAIDSHDRYKRYEERMDIKSPCGNQRFFGSASDDTKHGGGGSAENTHVFMTTLDRESDEDDEPSHEWMLNMQYDVLTNSPASSKDSKGNSDFNFEAMKESIPPSARANYAGNCSDNAPDASKESRSTFTHVMDDVYVTFDDDEGCYYLHGVERRPINLGDSFHIDQLIIKYLSEGATGKTDKGNHAQLHHRQIIQTIYDIYCRDPVIFRNEMAKILGPELVEKLGVYSAQRERDSRWLSNGLSATDFLKFHCVKDENGVSVWVHLFRKLKYIYNDWRVDRLEELTKQVMNDSLIFDMYVEAEAIDYFLPQYNWQRGSDLWK